MPDSASTPNVHIVRSLKEAQRIVLSCERFEAKMFSLRVFLYVWVAVANFLLKGVKLAFFGTKQLPIGQVRSIVVYSVGIVGDNIVLLPALASLRKQYPKATLTVITNCQEWSPQGATGVFASSTFKDRLIILQKDPVVRQGRRFRLAAELLKVRCDLFVNLSPFGNRGWLGAVVRELIFAKKLGAKQAVGFRMATLSRRHLFDRVQHCFVCNEPRRTRAVLAELNLTPLEGQDLLCSDEAAKKSVQVKLKCLIGDDRPFFVINPGAKFKSKCWPAARFGKISGWLSEEYGGAVVVTGTANEKEIAEDVVQNAGGNAISFAGGTSLQELVELLRLSQGCITNDTGTMHLAAMVNVPTVAIFSLRHSPTHWLPIGGRVASIFSLQDCRFCYDDYCATGECLHSISVDHVKGAFAQLMAEKALDFAS